MAKAALSAIVAEQKILQYIHVFRGHKVMLDADLATMYGVETKQLKRQVRRNPERFPKDFMFSLTRKEFENLRSQSGTSSWGGSQVYADGFYRTGCSHVIQCTEQPYCH